MDYLVVFIFGAIAGSFLNVCIYRIPRGRSIVKPRSFCPHCKNPIRWYDNVPLASYLILGGRCRDCDGRISIRYFVVELVTALCSVLVFFYFSLSAQFFVYLVLAYILIIVVFIDLERQEIPDVLSLPGIFLGIILVTVSAVFTHDTVVWKAFLKSLAGVLTGGGSMFLLGFFGELIFRKESLGGGDVKLMAMIGAFLGWKLVLLSFFLAPILGIGIAIFMKIKKKKEVVPYAPYLALGAMISLLYGERILTFLFYIG